MSEFEPGTESTPESPSGGGLTAEQLEWAYRGVAILVIVLLAWLSYRYRYDGSLVLLLLALEIGALIVALRLHAVSGAVHSIENWLNSGSARARDSDGKFARFFKRPFFSACLAIWRWTAPIPDPHLRAGVRLATLIIITGIAVVLLIMAIEILVAIAILILLIVVAGWFLSHSGNSGGRDDEETVTRHTTGFLGGRKDVHFDGADRKIAETTRETDWLGNPKLVRRDLDGNIVSESTPENDWLGNSKLVERDTDGTVISESTRESDWLGNSVTVQRDAEGNVIRESHEEEDIFGNKETVHENK